MKPSTAALSVLLALPLGALAAGPSPATCPAPAEPFAPGVISTEALHETRLAFTPDRATAFWGATETVGGPGSDEHVTILTARRTATGWSTPEVAPFSGVHSDNDPFVTPDGNSLVFSSNRPGTQGAYPLNDLWVTHRTAAGWSEPVNLGPAVNSPANELYASMDAAGNLYFASDRDRGQWDLYRAERRPDGTYAPAEALGPGVNHSHLWEFNPEISPDGRTLLFATYGRQDSYGDVDLYASTLQKNGRFGTPVNLGPCVNTAAPEFHPTVLWDEGVLHFVRVGATLDFFVAPLPALTR